MKRVLITGGNGALGKAVIQHLKKNGHYQIFVTSTKHNQINDPALTVLLCDFFHLDQLSHAFYTSKPDLILHLGGSFSVKFPEAYHVNVVPAMHLLELVQETQCKTRVVLIGSAAEYGLIKPEENPIKEDHALFPVSDYGVSKAWQTTLLGLYTLHGLDVVCARVFNLYGPGISTQLFAGRIQEQIDAIKAGQKTTIEVGALSATRDYVHINEAARQLLQIAHHGVKGNVYHIGSGKPITMRNFLLSQLELVGLSTSVIHELSSDSNHKGYDVPVIYANMEKTKNLEKQEEMSK